MAVSAVGVILADATGWSAAEVVKAMNDAFRVWGWWALAAALLGFAIDRVCRYGWPWGKK